MNKSINQLPNADRGRGIKKSKNFAVIICKCPLIVSIIAGSIALKHSWFFQEDQNRGKPNWEHLNDDLHVLITVEDSENRASLKLQRAVDEVKKLLIVVDDIIIQLYFNCLYRDLSSDHASYDLSSVRVAANILTA